MRRFDAPRPGGKLRAADLAEWLNETRRQGNISVEGATFTSGPGGVGFTIPGQKGFWAKITANGGGGKYSWEEVKPASNGSGFVTITGGRKGAYTTDAAIEAGLSATVPLNSIVRLDGPFPGAPVSGRPVDAYVFTYTAATGADFVMIKITGHTAPSATYDCVTTTPNGGGGWTDDATTRSAYVVNFGLIGAANYLGMTSVPEDQVIIGQRFIARRIPSSPVSYFFEADNPHPPYQALCKPILGSTKEGIIWPAWLWWYNAGALGTGTYPVYLVEANEGILTKNFLDTRRYVGVRVGWHTVTGGGHSSYTGTKLPVYAAHACLDCPSGPIPV